MRGAKRAEISGDTPPPFATRSSRPVEGDHALRERFLGHGVGFIVTNRTRPAERVIAFYNQRGAVEQWIKEGKGAIKWTPLFAPDLRRQHRPPPPPMRCASILGNFMRTLAMPEAAQPGSLTSLREKVIKIGAEFVSHGRCVTFQMAEVAVPRQIFADILALIARSRVPPAPARSRGTMRQAAMEEVCLGAGKAGRSGSVNCWFRPPLAGCWTRFAVAQAVQRRDPGLETGGNPANVGSE
jgi:hypothetical protein